MNKFADVFLAHFPGLFVVLGEPERAADPEDGDKAGEEHQPLLQLHPERGVRRRALFRQQRLSARMDRLLTCQSLFGIVTRAIFLGSLYCHSWLIFSSAFIFCDSECLASVLELKAPWAQPPKKLLIFTTGTQ